MNMINCNKPMYAKAIYVKGNSKPLRDRIVFFADRFLIVAQDENDTAPTWYNVDMIDKITGVEALHTTTMSRGKVRIL